VWACVGVGGKEQNGGGRGTLENRGVELTLCGSSTDGAFLAVLEGGEGAEGRKVVDRTKGYEQNPRI